MKRLSLSIRDAIRKQENYFRTSHQEIARRNLALMQTVCWALLEIFIAYYLFTRVFFPDMLVAPGFLLIIPVLLLCMCYLHRAKKCDQIESAHPFLFTRFMHLFLMAYIIALSVFSHPDVPSAYYPLFLMLGPVMFILPMQWHLLVNVCSLPVFCWLVLRFKLPGVRSHELFEAFTAMLFSVVLILLMMQFRVQGENLKARYYTLSREDGLTGALNKTSGRALAEEYLERRHSADGFALLFVDVDNFKHINDCYGHLEGDHLLQEFCNQLRAVSREEDILCRFGGDEFMLLLKQIGSTADAMAAAERIVRRAAAIALPDKYAITCSIGVFYWPGKPFTDLDYAIEKADEALYQAKKNGKGCAVLYEEKAG